MLLPEVVAMKGVEQSAPHIYDVWTHTLDVVKGLAMLLATLSEEYDAETASSLMLGLVSLRLGRYRQALEQHLGEQLNPDRSLRALLFLAGLYHDSGKPACRHVDEQGRTRFLGHDQDGEQRVEGRAQALRLSNLEIERIKLVVRHTADPAGNLPLLSGYRSSGCGYLHLIPGRYARYVRNNVETGRLGAPPGCDPQPARGMVGASPGADRTSTADRWECADEGAAANPGSKNWAAVGGYSRGAGNRNGEY